MKDNDDLAVSPTVLSLCSGYGGIDLGIRLACPEARTVCYVEIEAYAAGLLVARMADGSLDAAPVWSDLKTFDGKPWRGVVDIVTGGYPCQPFSVAGKRQGADDPRHLWPHIANIVADVRPPLVFLENVPGHLRLGFRQVGEDLQRLGYTVTAGLFSAAEVGASQERQRLFILAYARRGSYDPEQSQRLTWGSRAASFSEAGRDVAYAPQPRRGCGDGNDARAWQEDRAGFAGRGESVEHATDPRLERRREGLPGPGRCVLVQYPPHQNDWDGWDEWVRSGGPEPAIRRNLAGSADGVDEHRYRPDRLRALGNGVVPETAALAFLALSARAVRQALQVPA